MADVNTQRKIKLSSWPSPQDYNEAIQNLAENSVDAHLRNGHVHLTQLGLPRPLTGAFASVYRVDCATTTPIAVRCFLRDIKDQEARYEQISNFVQHDDLPYTVTFDFLRKGIRVASNWYPALKMDWVSGPTLDHFVSQHLHDSAAMAKLAQDFKRMCMDLHDAGIAHGDLQHGNIIVLPNSELRLVDYDGMYVPAMRGLHSNELGHRNYQHPARAAQHFNAELDNFSAWVIYVSLSALAIDPHLWQSLAGGDECLLFRRDDFIDPVHSFAFYTLENHDNESIRVLARFLRWQCYQQIDEVPLLNDAPPATPHLPPLAAPLVVSHPRQPKPRPQQHQQQPQQIKSAQNSPAAQPQPRASSRPATPVIPGVEPELNQPLPRWVANKAELFQFTSTRDEEFAAMGLPARTIQLSMTKHKEMQGKYEVTYYMMRYKFAVNGKVYSAVKRTDENRAMGLAGEKQLTVLYKRDDPSQNTLYMCIPFRAVNVTIPPDVEPELLPRRRPPKTRQTKPANYYESAKLTALFLTVLVAMLAFLGVALQGWMLLLAIFAPFMVVFTKNTKYSGLVATGVPARARVINVEAGRDHGVRIKYRYQSHSGPVQASLTTSDPVFESVKLGDRITVLYNIDKPRSHIVYDLSPYKA